MNHTDKRTGFTLAEMLVVMLILMLLVAMVMPSFSAVLLSVHRQVSQTIINTLDQAVGMYQQDFSATSSSMGGDTGGLPESRPTDTAGTGWYGCQWIVQCLTGYLDTDGHTGMGIRTSGKNSPIYGPYNGTDQLKTSSSDGSNPRSIKDSALVARPVFVDAFGKPILYYKCNKNTTGYYYNLDDNPDSSYQQNGYDTQVNEYVIAPVPSVSPDTMRGGNPSSYFPNAITPPPPFTYIRDSSNSLYRTDFMFLTWGADAMWYAPEYFTSHPGFSSNWNSKPPLSTVKDDANNLYGK